MIQNVTGMMELPWDDIKDGLKENPTGEPMKTVPFWDRMVGLTMVVKIESLLYVRCQQAQIPPEILFYPTALLLCHPLLIAGTWEISGWKIQIPACATVWSTTNVTNGQTHASIAVKLEVIGRREIWHPSVPSPSRRFSTVSRFFIF